MGKRGASRVALGLVVLAAERVRQRPVGDRVLLAVGVARESAYRARMLAESVTAPTARVARRAGSALGELPGAGLVAAPLAVARQRWAAAARDARLVGAATVAAGRLDARSFLTGSVDEAVVWAEREVIPSVIDSLVPHLVAQTVPRIIEGAMPEIRLRVLPVVVDELTADPKVRDLVSEQGRGMIGDAARELRTSAASADDRVESAFQRLLHRPPRPPTGTAVDGQPVGGEPDRPPVGGG